MTKSIYLAAFGLAMFAGALAPALANAQTAMAMMPVLYNQAGQQVNAGNTTPLAAGTYYLATGAQHPVYYYGNGTYYDTSIGIYGGSAVNDPNGTAGVNLGYSASVLSPDSVTTTPGAPNTGAGGEAMATWLTLILAVAAIGVGGAYLAKSYAHETTR